MMKVSLKLPNGGKFKAKGPDDKIAPITEQIGGGLPNLAMPTIPSMPKEPKISAPKFRYKARGEK